MIMLVGYITYIPMLVVHLCWCLAVCELQAHVDLVERGGVEARAGGSPAHLWCGA